MLAFAFCSHFTVEALDRCSADTQLFVCQR